ncbi:MAG: DUF3015 domain-containing protein, partial [Myxococcota bacterium]
CVASSFEERSSYPSLAANECSLRNSRAAMQLPLYSNSRVVQPLLVLKPLSKELYVKKLFIVCSAMLAFPTLAYAQGYGMAGCGLGSLVFGNDQGIVQIFAATTNGTLGSQTFGITSGTSNCVDGGGVAAVDKKAFVKMNYASLMRDAAVGKGEYLSTLASMMGCEEAAHVEFFQATQKNHQSIFNEKADAEATLKSVHDVVQSDPSLARQCTVTGV